MPSFDIVSEVDLQEVRNAVDQAGRELDTRFDFRGVDSGFALDGEHITLHAEEAFQLGQLRDILESKLIKRGIDVRVLDEGEVEASGKQKRQRFGLKQGIDKETAKRIVKLVKESKLKVQCQIQGEQVRVTGKKRDDLQEIMALTKEAKLPLPLSFTNFRD